jgi:hypothetical protein
MKSHRDGTKRRAKTLRAWTYEEACKALPYISSVLRTVRDHRINALQHDRTAQQLARRPGRPNRDDLIAHEEAVASARRANDQFREALVELHALDIYCLDPIAGTAVIPFVHDNQLAWFLFDLFAEQPIRFWRYHTDPLDTQRPLAEALADPSSGTLSA